MKLLFLLAAISAGYYFYTNQQGSGGSTGSTSNGSKEKISEALDDATSVSEEYYTNMNKLKNAPLSYYKEKTDSFITKYSKSLGKAYKLSSGDDKRALKYIRDFATQWVKLHLKFITDVSRLFHSMKKASYNYKERVRNYEYFILELKKIVNAQLLKLDTWGTSFHKNMKKFKIKNSGIKDYVISMADRMERNIQDIKAYNKSKSLKF